MRRGWQWLFGPIRTQQDAIQVLSDVSKGWYLVAAIQFVLFAITSWRAGFFINSLDSGIYLAAGYFLPRKKSRSFAWAMLVFSIYVFFLNVASRFWKYQSGTNFVIAALVVAFAYRGVRSCSVLHSKAHTIWKNVAIVWGSTIIATGLVFVGGLVAMIALYPNWENELSDNQTGLLFMVPMILVWFALFLVLPRRFPLIESPPTQLR